MVVCNGLYYDLEYEEMHVESTIKSNGLGVMMNKKVKRLGCSAIKDIIENRKLDIVDDDTILEVSTFVAKGQSYEASDGNHDDLIMNLVMFGFFVQSTMFGDLTNIDIKKMLFERQALAIDDDLPPFGIVDDGSDAIAEYDQQEQLDHMKANWAIDYSHKHF
tara:strand:- start:1638 stop:2123 length:486 start_codon:yes stop_codon:yes gene_type:complete